MKKQFLPLIALFICIASISAQDTTVVEINENLKNDFYQIKNDDAEVLQFFKKNNYTEYYNSFDKARRIRKVGHGLLIGGLASIGAGGIFITAGILSYAGIFPDNMIFATAFLITGATLAYSGSFVTIASIPVLVVGKKHKQRIKNSFEKEYLTQYQPQINFGLNTGGIGFAVNF
ncbi:MAG: hypothetical protein LBS50_00175 [Prevotellaceae bacterium]|jgi:hypothetical protein|nr:hypothetical protein [Prevotellaceae bacterium]